MQKYGIALALLFLISISFAASLTYQQDGTPTITTGAAAGGTLIANINADDTSYYIINAAQQTSNNEASDSGTNDCGTTVTGTSYANTSSSDNKYWNITSAKGCGDFGGTTYYGWSSYVTFTNVGVSSANIVSITWIAEYHHSTSSITTSVQMYNYTGSACVNLTTGITNTSDATFSGRPGKMIFDLRRRSKKLRISCSFL